MKRQVSVVYLAGLVQGLSLVAFPAASGLLTSPTDFNLSSSAYGGLFLPQALLSIAGSLFSSTLVSWIGNRWVFIWGLLANFLAMALLAFSVFIMHGRGGYGLLLTATGSLGVGFGLVVPILNAFAVQFFPKKSGKAVLGLNALLGAGMALSPLLIALFVGVGIWWALPLCLALALAILILCVLRLVFPEEKRGKKPRIAQIPWQFWLFALFALLYGIVETVNGNWGALYMKRTVHGDNAVSLMALTVFWTMVTLGRVFFAATGRFFSERWTFCFLPLLAAGALFFIAESKSELTEVALFGLSGLGCSALLPLTVSLSNKACASMGSSSVAGGVICFYLLGYGLAAFGVGPLLDVGMISLQSIFIWTAGTALCLTIIAVCGFKRLARGS
ncbi:MAG: MFS transporter [Rhabdochlamydiaceae bacterium]|nr:MFS transporter [Rhabdochlamydiaceae bacterium]